jgi:hypothetical protein
MLSAFAAIPACLCDYSCRSLRLFLLAIATTSITAWLLLRLFLPAFAIVLACLSAVSSLAMRLSAV